MKRLLSFVALNEIPSAFLDGFQDAAAGVVVAGLVNGATYAPGADEVVWYPKAGAGGLANGTPVTIDTTVDWRKRKVSAEYIEIGSDADLPGGASDYVDWSTVAGASYIARGFLGTGGYSALGPPVAVSAGNPPIASTGGGVNSYRVTLHTNFYAFADPTTGALILYNNTGAPIWPHLTIRATGVRA